MLKALFPFAAVSAACTTIAITLAPCAARADNTLFAPDEPGTEVISVVGSRTPQAELPVPAAIQIISRTDIERTGAQTLQQVLATLGGIQLIDNIGNGGRGSSLSLRGFGENGISNVLVLVDGRKLNNPNLAGPDLTGITLTNIQRIEILYGSAGALYGDQASAGVINIITGQTDGKRVEVASSRGSDDGERYQLTIQDRFANGGSYRLSSEKKLADNFRVNNEQNFRHDAGAFGYRNESLQLRLDIQQTEDALRLPGSLTRAQRDADREQSLSPNDFGDRQTEAWRAGAELQLTDNWQLLLDLHDRDEHGDGALYATPYRYRTQLSAAQPRVVGQLGNATLLLGLDAEEADAEADYGYGASAISQQTRDLYSQLSLPLANDWNLTAGGRHSQFEGDHNLADTVEQSLNAWQLGLSKTLTTEQRLFLRRDQGFRWASADENGFISPSVSALAPQRSVSWELGWDWHTSHANTLVTLYHLQLQDEIFYDPSADGPFGAGTGANINLDDSSRRGLTVRSTWQLTDTLHSHFNASRVDARFDSGNFSGKTLPFVAEQQAGLGVSWQLFESLSLYADGQYTGARYFAGDNSNSAGLLGGYTLFNASARWQTEHYSITLRINNAGDKHYDGFAGVSAFGPAYYYPAAGRQLEVTVTAGF